MTLRLRASSLRHLGTVPVAAVLLACTTVAWGAAPADKKPDHASSYYHYALAHLYEDMAVNAGRSDYAQQAVEQYKLALDADPDSKVLQDGLADLYFRIGRVRDAVSVAQAQIAKDPNDVAAHTLLGKIYLRSLTDTQSAQAQQILQLAIGEYEKLAQLKPNDVETHLLLGQLYSANHDSAKAEAQFKAAQNIDADSEDVVLNLAQLYTNQGDTERAVQVLKGVPVDDRTSRIEMALGAGYDQLKKPKDAIAAYQRALDQDPDNPDVERSLANSLMDDGQLDAALKLFKTIVAAEPQDAQSQIHISEIQRQQGHYDDALATLNNAKPLVKDSLELSYNEALIYDALGRYDEAIAVLTKLVDDSAHEDGKYTDQEKANRALFVERMGIVYREENKTTEAVAAYQKEIELGGDYARSGYQGVVDSYRDAHQWKDATDAADAAAKAMPKDHQVQLMYAGQLADAGQVSEALSLAKAQFSDKSSVTEQRDGHFALAQMYTRLKRFPEAAAELDAAAPLATASQDKLYLAFLRGALADREKNYDAAEAQFKIALGIDPQNSTVLNYYGYMLADRGVRLDDAQKMIQKAVSLDPQNGAFLDSLGWVYFKSGQYDLSEQYLKKAIARLGNDPTVRDHLGEVYEKTGRLKLAVDEWKQSMADYAQSLPADADPADVAKVQHKLENARVKLAKVSTAGK